MTKLAIVQEREEDKYDHVTTVRCWKCDPVNGKEIVADDNTACISRALFSLLLCSHVSFVARQGV